MALGPVGDWSSTFNSLPKVGDTSWAANLADAVDGLTTGKLELTNIKTTPASFIFGKAAFEAALLPLQPVDSAMTGAQNFAGAWEQGILASVMSVSSGASVGLPATPANTFSAPPATILDAPSLVLAKAGLVSAIASIVPSENADTFAEAFRNAFLALTYTSTGLNSVTPTPATLVDAADPTAYEEAWLLNLVTQEMRS